SKTPFPSVWTHDHARRALAAARHTDRILGPLETTHPWPLVGRLDDFSRQHCGRCFGTLYLEVRPIQSCLDGHLLFITGLPPQSKALEVSEVAVFTEEYVQTEVFS